MKVKTGELRDHLSHYLKRVRQTGDTITVMDRNRPVAEIRPYAHDSDEAAADVWMRRAQLEAELGSLDEDIELPARRTHSDKRSNPLD